MESEIFEKIAWPVQEKRGEKTEEAKRIMEGAKQEAGGGEAMETGDEAKHYKEEKATEPQVISC